MGWLCCNRTKQLKPNYIKCLANRVMLNYYLLKIPVGSIVYEILFRKFYLQEIGMASAGK